MVGTFAYVKKHVWLLKRYFILSLAALSEYKMVFYMNLAQYIILGAVWIIFWNLLLSDIDQIAHWRLPMLIMLTGFVYFNQALAEMFWEIFQLDRKIIKGELDMYLVRPISTLFGLTIGRMNVGNILPGIIGFGIITFAVVKYYQLMTIQFLLSLVACILGVVIIQTIMAIIGTGAFWLGNMSSIRMTLRSFKMAERYPIDLYSLFIRGFFTFVMPYIFIGTFPVLIITQYTLQESFFVLFIELFVCVFWLMILFYLWNRGVRRYESVGS